MSYKNLKEFKFPIDYLLTDIDDTLTDNGRLCPEAYQALWNLSDQGIKVIPVTGRPAGWCELIARQWPVAGVIGENGGFYFRYAHKKMHRVYHVDEATRITNRQILEKVKDEILTQVSGAAVASDQFCRQLDLAIDFCEDVMPLTKKEVFQIVSIFEKHGATAKVSSIHVNGWFGSYDKKQMAFQFLTNEFNLTEEEITNRCAFSGDSPNDEPMFAFFKHSFGVANILDFKEDLIHPPTYISSCRGGLGFKEIADQIFWARSALDKKP